MEHPLKRRKLSPMQYLHATSSTSNYNADGAAVASAYPLQAPRPYYSHGLEDLKNRDMPQQRVDEVHMHIRNHSLDREARHLYRRQTIVGTAASSSSTPSSSTPAVSAAASASLAVSDSVDSSSTADSSSSQAEATTTPLSSSDSASASDSSSAQAAATSSASADASTSTTPADSSATTSMGAAVSSSSSSGSSAEDTTPTDSVASSTALASTDGSAITSSAPSSSAAGSASLSSTGSNGTVTTSSSSASAESTGSLASAAASISSASTSSTADSQSASNGSLIGTSSGSTPFPTASVGANVTTSAIIISDSSTTYTSFTTYNRNSASRTVITTTTSSRGSSSSGSSSRTITTIGTYTDYSTSIKTLSGGSITTISEAREAQVTTLSNGDYSTSYGSYSTIAAASSSTSTDSDSVSSSATSSASAASSDGSALAGSAASGTQSSSASAASTSAASSDSGDASTAPASVLAGGIVGGIAGLAVLLLVALVFLRWYKKRTANMQPLTEAEAARSGDAPSAPQGPGMATRAGLAPVLAPLLGGGVFKSRREAETGPPAPVERGFQRVSGRKLPSAFSEGMEGISSPPPGIAPAAFAHNRDLSNTSFYRDSAGFHGGEGPFADQGDAEQDETVSPMPGPARQPKLHSGGPYTALSPTSATTVSGPSSPTWPPSGQAMLSPTDGRFSPGLPLSPPGTAGRSATPATLSSFEGSRGSRFTEEV